MSGISFWNSGPTHQTAGHAIFLKENFARKIQNIKQDDSGRISSIVFNLYKQTLQILNIYGPNKPHQRKHFFQSISTYFINAQNTIIEGAFNMAENLNHRSGDSIFNTHLVGSQALFNIIQNQNLQDTWRKMNSNKSEFTCHRIQSNIHSRLDRIYATKNINILEAKIMPFEHSDNEALITEFILRTGL